MRTPCPSGKYITFRLLARLWAISSPASIFLNSMSPFPASLNALANNSAPSASPSAEIIAACFCCSAYTINQIRNN